MPNNITIPLNSPVDFASYEKVTSPNNEVSFSKKESMYYRNCLSNIRKIDKEGFTTTNGKLVHLEGDEAYYDNVPLGIDLHKGVFAINKKELPTNFPGKRYAVTSILNGDILVVFSKSDSQGYITYYDKDFNLINTNSYTLDPTPSEHIRAIPLRRIQGDNEFYTLESMFDYFILISWIDTDEISIKSLIPERNEDGTFTESSKYSNTAKYSFPWPKPIQQEKVPLFSYLGETYEAVVYKKESENQERVVLAFDDIDQRKRCAFEFSVTLIRNVPQIYTIDMGIPFFGTVGMKDGKPILTGEPLPINHALQSNIPFSNALFDVLYPFRYERNGVISWIICKKHKENPGAEYSRGYSRFYVHEESTTFYENNATWKAQAEQHDRFQNNVFFSSVISLGDNTLEVNKALFSKRVYPNSQIFDSSDWVPKSLYVVSTPYPYDLGSCSPKHGNMQDNKTFNPFPTGTVYTNISENRGKYWDYGESWSRMLSFTWALYRGKTNDNMDILQTPLLILEEKDFEIADPMSLPAISHVSPGDLGTGQEYIGTWQNIGSAYLDNGAFAQQLLFPNGTNDNMAKNDLQMPTLSNILGGTNVEGWVMSLPFEADTSLKNIKSQWYRGLKVAHTFSNNNKISTTLSTPGDDLAKPLSILYGKSEGAYNEVTVLDGNLIYTIAIPVGVNPEKYLSIEKVSDYMFRLNVLNLPNLILEHSDNSFSLVSSFDGYAMPSRLNIKNFSLRLPPSGSDTNNIFIFASGYNQEKYEENPSTSFLFPYIQIPFYLDSTDSLYFNKMCKDLKEGIIEADTSSFPTQRDDRPIDVYYSHLGIGTIPEYQYTLKESGRADADLAKIFDIDKAGFIWETTAEEMYFPIGICSILKSQNYITPTVQLSSDYSIRLLNRNNQTYMIFNNSARTYKGQVIFTIYGGNYTYDGQGIYYIGSGNDYSQSQFVCYALGLRFLANSGSEAYFYSPWEKRLFIFTGSNTLQADESYSSLGDVADSLFSSNEQTLYLLFDTEEKDRRVLVGKTPNDTSTLSVAPDAKLSASSKGVIVYNDVEYLADQTSQTLSPSVGDLVPFKVETEYIGDPATLYKFSYIDLLFYGIKKDISFTVTYDVINGITKTTETKEINLKAADWKAESYRYTFTPTHMMGNSCRIGIKSDDELYLSYIGIGIDEASTNPTAPRTKGK